MPDSVDYAYGYRRFIKRGWKYMARWERKQFHRDNESRVRKGLEPLPKPKTIFNNGLL